MTTLWAEKSPLFIARVAGILYLLLVPLGLFGILYVPSVLIVEGNAAETVGNIADSESLFRLSIVTALLVQLVNMLLVLVLYRLLKPANKTFAFLMVVFFMVSVPISMLNELNQISVLALLSDADYLSVFELDQLHAQVMLFLDMHEGGTFIASIFWGLWLLPMGYLVFISGFLPRWIGVLLVIGGFGYLTDSVVFFLLPDFDVVISQFTFVGEVALPLWLLVKGVNVERWRARASASA